MYFALRVAFYQKIFNISLDTAKTAVLETEVKTFQENDLPSPNIFPQLDLIQGRPLQFDANDLRQLKSILSPASLKHLQMIQVYSHRNCENHCVQTSIKNYKSGKITEDCICNN